MGIVVKNFFVASVALGMWLLIDYMYVKSGQNDESMCPDALGYLLLILTPVGFYMVNQSFFRDRNDPSRHLYPILLAGAFTIVWFVVSFIIVTNFHFLIGGRK